MDACTKKEKGCDLLVCFRLVVKVKWSVSE